MLKASQNPGRKDLVIMTRDCQWATSSARGVRRLIPPKKFSTARVIIPAQKSQLASECRFRSGAASASPLLNSAAENASKELKVTREELKSGKAEKLKRRPNI